MGNGRSKEQELVPVKNEPCGASATIAVRISLFQRAILVVLNHLQISVRMLVMRDEAPYARHLVEADRSPTYPLLKAPQAFLAQILTKRSRASNQKKQQF